MVIQSNMNLGAAWDFVVVMKVPSQVTLGFRDSLCAPNLIMSP